jgi:hypothetical protein
LEGYERDFVLKIKGLVREGPDFAALVKDVLLETAGEAGSSALLNVMDKATLEQPARFAQELSKFLGAGAASVLKIVVIRASGSRKSPAERSSGGTPANPAVRQWYLHDQRMKDELDEYRERIAQSESNLS